MADCFEADLSYHYIIKIGEIKYIFWAKSAGGEKIGDLVLLRHSQKLRYGRLSRPDGGQSRYSWSMKEKSGMTRESGLLRMNSIA